MKKTFFAFLLSVLCAFYGMGAQSAVSNDGTTVRITEQGKRQTGGGTSEVDHAWCEGKTSGTDCTQIVRGQGATLGKCTKSYTGEMKCQIFECDLNRGYYYVAQEIKQKNKPNFIRAMGRCDKLNCPEGLAPQTEIVATDKWEKGTKSEIMSLPVVVKYLNQPYPICFTEGAPCTKSMLESLFAIKGTVYKKPDVSEAKGLDDYYCRPTVCVQTRSLVNDGNDNATCCPKCDPTHADCSLVEGLNVGMCQYQTQCHSGYDQNENYAGKNTAKPVCEANKYNITYNLNSGTGDCSPATYTYGVGATINCSPTRENNIFKGWCTGSEFSNCSETQSIGTSDTGDKTFYAQWVEKKCEEKYSDPAQRACICTEKKEWDVQNKTCGCGEGKEWKNNKCENATKCPDNAEGDYPNCRCTENSKNYNSNTNTCDPICNEAIATWNNGECKCKNEERVYRSNPTDISQSTCGCPNGKTEDENGQCITPTNCPDDAEGDYPDCRCTENSKNYNSNTNTCDPICNEAIATWNGQECKCKNEERVYRSNPTDISQSTCGCPDGKTEDENGQCITPQKCPDDAEGNYPDCKCKVEGKIYNKDTGTCGCSGDKKEEGGQCVTPKACPSDSTGTYPDCKCNDEDKRYDEEKNECVEDELKKKQKAYDDAKEKEQSKENRTLTALTTAATGIGGMELAMGLSQQAADKEADQNMAAYIATMRCSYGDGQQVKAGPDEIELPGGNSSELMSLRNEYFALAADLKERKNALGMKPGIESEEIIDKTQTGLYDDESLGIDSGAYASLYRAQMLGSEADQAKIDEERKASKNRVIAGGVLVGAGVVGGMIGDSLINGKLGERIKERKKDKEKIKESAEATGKLSSSSLELMKLKGENFSLSPENTNDLVKAVKEKFKQ